MIGRRQRGQDLVGRLGDRLDDRGDRAAADRGQRGQDLVGRLGDRLDDRCDGVFERRQTGIGRPTAAACRAVAWATGVATHDRQLRNRAVDRSRHGLGRSLHGLGRALDRRGDLLRGFGHLADRLRDLLDGLRDTLDRLGDLLDHALHRLGGPLHGFGGPLCGLRRPLHRLGRLPHRFRLCHGLSGLLALGDLLYRGGDLLHRVRRRLLHRLADRLRNAVDAFLHRRGSGLNRSCKWEGRRGRRERKKRNEGGQSNRPRGKS